MKIAVLVENCACTSRFQSEHGLCVYVENQGERWLLDTGKTGMFLKNAIECDVDIKKIDHVFLSHGHYDHVGGLKEFLKYNERADVYVSRNICKSHYSLRADGQLHEIGIDNALLENDRIVICEMDTIGKAAVVIAHVEGNRFLSEANNNLFEYAKSGELCPDTFSDEQSLLLCDQDGTYMLYAGCAHRGIVNILESCKSKLGRYPDVVIGGFHLMIPNTKTSIDPDCVQEMGRYLKKLPCLYLTGHCTGQEAFEILKEELEERIQEIHAGNMFEIRKGNVFCLDDGRTLG